MVELGDEVRDMLSGFEGIAVSKTSFYLGCERVNVQPKVKKDGTLPGEETFDDPQLEVIKSRATLERSRAKKKKKAPPGGPRSTPQRAKTPKR